MKSENSLFSRNNEDIYYLMLIITWTGLFLISKTVLGAEIKYLPSGKWESWFAKGIFLQNGSYIFQPRIGSDPVPLQFLSFLLIRKIVQYTMFAQKMVKSFQNPQIIIQGWRFALIKREEVEMDRQNKHVQYMDIFFYNLKDNSNTV